ncbi:MAG: hypothetical protein R3F59_06950 [Myxococcota bacterium]
MGEVTSTLSENGTDHGVGGYPPPEADTQDLNPLDLVQDAVVEQARTRPYTTLAVAAAAGYVLGGGVPWWAVRGLLSIGSRIVVARALASVVEDDH